MKLSSWSVRETGGASNGLLKRVCKDYPEFRRLSFGKLRKTASSLIRRFGDGETAGVFLCHGHPVRGDALLDVYANRDFASVFRAIKKVEQHLQPVFEAAPSDLHAQPDPNKTGRKKIKRLCELKEQGLSIREIAEEVGMSKSAVARHVKNSVSSTPS